MQYLPLQAMFEMISHIVPPDTSIAVADERQFVAYKPGQTINLNIQPGDDIHQRTVTYQALTKQQKVSDVDKDVFGTPYYGVSFPIITDDEPRGCITSILPTKLRTYKQPFLTIRHDDRWLPTSFTEIIFIEAEQRKTFVQATNVYGRHQMNLRQLELLLPEQFIRTHRAYIVNVDQIVEIHPDSHSTFMLKMTNGYRVPVSQTYASKFRTLLHF